MTGAGDLRADPAGVGIPGAHGITRQEGIALFHRDGGAARSGGRAGLMPCLSRVIMVPYSFTPALDREGLMTRGGASCERRLCWGLDAD